MSKPFKLVDESGDKKYFTVIPNLVINHSSHWERDLYLIMKRIAGEKGTCYASIYTLAKRAGISAPTISRTIKKLLKRGWIEFIGTRPGKTRPVREYRIVDIWKENIQSYEKIVSQGNNLSEDSKTTETKIVSPVSLKKNQYKRRNNTRKAKSFPRENYNLILDAYQHYKGIKLSGPEFLSPQKAIKTMFEADRKPNEIIAFMKWTSENLNTVPWMRNWTLWTIQKKIAEFSAGKLKAPDWDDSTPL